MAIAQNDIYAFMNQKLTKTTGVGCMKHFPVVIIGAGPAGLTAGYELIKQGIKPIVLEKDDKVGGISRT